MKPTLSNNRQSSKNHPRSNQNLSDEYNILRKKTHGTMKTLALFFWPKKKLSLQLLVLMCLAIIVVGRLINYYVPIYNKQIIDGIDISSGVYRWDLVLIYVGLKFLQRGATGGIGLLNNLRAYFWMQIQHYTCRNAHMKLFRHLHGLSLRWYLSCKTGEVLHVMNRGINSMNKLFDGILFSILPTILDIFVMVIFFMKALSKWLGLIVLTTVILYIVVTICITQWLHKFQRRKNSAENAQKAQCADSLINFETVKYYGAESIEANSYEKAILEYQNEEWGWMKTLNILHFSRNLIVTFGLLVGSLLCLHMVVNREGLTIGDYVLFSSGIIQLYVPLNSFGTYYGAIQQNVVDMENMFALLRESQDIKDTPGSKPLVANRGQLEFSNVSFSYTPERPILKNISFIVPPGKTIALIGPSGAGKSTIIRLLFRLYDANTGAIIIDQQDIRDVSQDSLRESIGVVPQDSVLFNNTIKYNIQYGNIGASDADVIAAAKCADIHDQIVKLREGYDTKVGERGLCLSGGEKQRIAIARTILKAPRIVLLDEATSALDTQTERNIQVALNRFCADRTTIIVSHRPSTIAHAHEILVLKEGEIAERGRHEDLIARTDGIYYAMWQMQSRSEKEAYNDQVKSSANHTSRYVIHSFCLLSSTLLVSVLIRLGNKFINSQRVFA